MKVITDKAAGERMQAVADAQARQWDRDFCKVMATREGRPFLRINGIQIQGEEITDLGPELPTLRELGVDVLRLYPQVDGMAEVIAHFDLARRTQVAPPRIGARNGFWHGEPGMRPVSA